MSRKLYIFLFLLLLIITITKVVHEVTSYDYKLCREGVYTKYPKGVIDGNSTYYKFGIKMATCGFHQRCTSEQYDYYTKVCK